MGRTFLRQDDQIRHSCVYDDTVVPSEANFETNPSSLQEDLNNIRSQLSNLLDDQAGNWYDDLNTPATLDPGSQRGVNDLNTDLHELERKRFLTVQKLLVDVTVGGSDNFVILGTGELPSNTTAAVGAVTTEGTVVAAHAGTFGTHSLDEVSGSHALAPKNILEITDNAGDPILSSGRRIWGLLQSENAVDGHTITDTASDRVQISFVRPNATHDDLEAVPAVDIQGQDIRYCYCERKAFDDLTEGDFAAKGAAIDIGAGAASVTRQASYDNQGVTPVDLTTNATLDLEGAGLTWSIRDDLEAALLSVIEGSAGGTSEVEISSDVDLYDNNAADVDFASGASINSGGTRPIDVGVTDGVIESTSGDLEVQAAAELLFDDVNQTGSTWAQDGIKLSEDTAEWDAFEPAFGEVSLLNAITQAKNSSNVTKTCATSTADVAADTDIGGAAGGVNLDAQLGDLSTGTFVDDHDIYLNGQLLLSGSNAAANNDVYPGTSLALGQLRFEFPIKTGDVICTLSRA